MTYVLKTDVVEAGPIFRRPCVLSDPYPYTPPSAPGNSWTVNGLLRGRRVFVLVWPVKGPTSPDWMGRKPGESPGTILKVGIICLATRGYMIM